MTTILTVHGTFAGDDGKETGQLWWQKGSPFEKHIKELVEAEHGALDYRPVTWDGLNSEMSRRAAGLALFQEMKALEKQGEPFVAIGHSHGGSVIASSLTEAARRQQRLDHLRSWLTIGTPFIATRRHRWLFQRLGTFGKSIFIALIFAFICGVLLVPKWGWIAALKAPEERLCTQASASYLSDSLHCIGNAVPTAIIAIVPFVIFYFAARYLESKNVSLYSDRAAKFAETTYRNKWSSLWHKNDEAVTALGSLNKLQLDILGRNFAVNLLSWLSILGLPVAYLMLVSSPGAMQTFNAFAIQYINNYPVWKRNHPDPIPGGGDSVFENHIYLIETGFMKFMDLLGGWGGEGSPMVTASRMLLAGVLLSSLLVAISLTFTVVLGRCWQALSAAASRRGNPLITSQFRAQAFGSDTSMDTAHDAHVWPMWMGKGFPPLPEPLGSELQAFSDDAIREVVPKFRDAAGTFAAATTAREKSDMISDYLTWNELIHTSYFNNARFRKLVAFTLTQAEGFRATDAFRRDPEYDLVAGWHGEITGSAPSHEVAS